MCGIAGFWDQSRLLGLEPMTRRVRRMTNALIHRGPDAGGVWLDAGAGVALGHRRLSILDLSPDGAQPMRSHSRSPGCRAPRSPRRCSPGSGLRLPAPSTRSPARSRDGRCRRRSPRRTPERWRSPAVPARPEMGQRARAATPRAREQLVVRRTPRAGAGRVAVPDPDRGDPGSPESAPRWRRSRQARRARHLAVFPRSPRSLGRRRRRSSPA